MKGMRLTLIMLSILVENSLAMSPTAQDISGMPPAPSQQGVSTSQTPTPSPAQQPTQQTQPTQTTTLKPLPLTPYQILAPFRTADGKIIKKTDLNRYNLPVAAQLTSVFMVNSNTYANLKQLFINYPSASSFFPNDPSLASRFSELIGSIQKEQIFFLFLKRLHSTVLQELYAYLKKIYATFDLTFINTTKDYVVAEQTFALNSKKLILHHLMNIVDGQSYQFSQSLFPTLQDSVATHVGSTLLNNDRMVDLDWLIIPQAQLKQEVGSTADKVQTIVSWQKKNLNLFRSYFNFFKQYANQIAVLDPDKGYLGLSKIVTDAQSIRQVIKKQSDLKNPINPQFFFPSQGTIQAFEMIPKLIQNIPKSVQSLPLPSQIVDAAHSGIHPKNNVTGAELSYPIAYFKNVDGSETTYPSSNNSILCMNLLSGADPYELELLPQPAWLNNKEGIFNILRGALGDFSSLIGMNILDPDTEKVIKAAVS